VRIRAGPEAQVRIRRQSPLRMRTSMRRLPLSITMFAHAFFERPQHVKHQLVHHSPALFVRFDRVPPFNPLQLQVVGVVLIMV